MKENILKLRGEGKTYREIKKLLNCSLSTISFHCGVGQKEKSKLRGRKSRSVFKNFIRRRICYFQKRSDNNRVYEKNRSLTFSVEDFLNKFGLIANCALTGEEINLKTDRNWEIDHIIPKYNGGDNSLNNCQIILKDINRMKHRLSEKEFIDNCIKILTYKGVLI